MRSRQVLEQREQIETIDKLAEAFKGISSLHISRIKNQVLSSKQFFADIWHIYTQLRSHPERAHREDDKAYPDRQVFLVVTAEGGLSGDIDKKLVDWMLKQYQADTTDIIVLGHHGVLQLAQAGVEIKKYYKIPDTDISEIDTSQIIRDIMQYGKVKVFYQTYIKLNIQDIASIDLLESVQKMGKEAKQQEHTMTIHNYIFEPSLEEVVQYMESIMLGIALSQVILESKLAQYASRFNAMSAAHDRSGKMIKNLTRSYNRTKRAEADERIREVVNGLKGAGTW